MIIDLICVPITVVIHWNRSEMFFMQMVSTPMLSGKFLHLKDLQISLAGMAAYDYFSLVSFLDASPHLENFVLAVSHCIFHSYFVSMGGLPSQVSWFLWRVVVLILSLCR